LLKERSVPLLALVLCNVGNGCAALDDFAGLILYRLADEIHKGFCAVGLDDVHLVLVPKPIRKHCLLMCHKCGQIGPANISPLLVSEQM